MHVRRLAIAVLTGILAACGQPQVTQERQAIDTTRITTQSGDVSGSVEDGVVSYKGIPYAKPPVGDLRWRAPQAIGNWGDVLQANTYGNDCMQIPFAADEAPLRTTPAEDCLYLNVWKPEAARPGNNLPVIVWIYGGGWVNGGVSPAVYDGAPTARKGTIFVSFNYRLGRFGFFAHPALTTANEDDGLLGNYGYMDQLAALKWVQDNIGAFGGDPDKVTIMGESAGGGSVVNLLTSGQADGLFQQAVAMSAPARMDARLKPLHSDGPDAEDDGIGFSEWAGVTGDGIDALASLRNLPAETVVAGTGMAARPVAPASGPMLDGTIIAGADKVLAEGRQIKVPTMAGAVSEDLGFGPPLSPAELFAQFPDPEAARRAYSEYDGDDAILRQFMYADIFMQEPARFIIEAQASHGEPAYYYRYGYVAETMRSEWTGTHHATDIPFFLNTVDARYGDAVTPEDRAAANQINTYLVNFARTGDPNGDGLPEWPAYTPDAPVMMNFTQGGAAAGPDPWQTRLDLVEAQSTLSRK